MEPILEIPLNKLLDKVYNLDPESYLELERYHFDQHYTPVDDYSIKRFHKIRQNMKDYRKINDSEIEQIVRLASHFRYEESYPIDVYNRVIEYGIDAIERDFKEVNDNIIYDDIQFDLYLNNEPENEIKKCIKEQERIINENIYVKVDQNTNIVKFYGSLEKLAYIIIAAIHGYGYFRYSGLFEFCDVGESDPITNDLLKKTIIDHIHWLNSWNKIYGDGCFTLNENNISSKLNYVYSLGDYNFTEEHIQLALECTISHY